MKIGKIDISRLNIPPEKHELAAAKVFAAAGMDIEFIKPVNVKGVRTPDFKMCGIEWELKSPVSKNLRSIEDNFRDAMKQSKNIIFDLARIKMPEAKCIEKIIKESQKHKNVRRVLIIKKNRKILTIRGSLC